MWGGGAPPPCEDSGRALRHARRTAGLRNLGRGRRLRVRGLRRRLLAPASELVRPAHLGDVRREARGVRRVARELAADAVRLQGRKADPLAAEQVRLRDVVQQRAKLVLDRRPAHRDVVLLPELLIVPSERRLHHVDRTDRVDRRGRTLVLRALSSFYGTRI